jgi:hypothetical protein
MTLTNPSAPTDALYTLRATIANLHAELDNVFRADSPYKQRRDETIDGNICSEGRFEREKEIRKEILRLTASLEALEHRPVTVLAIGSVRIRIWSWLAKMLKGARFRVRKGGQRRDR